MYAVIATGGKQYKVTEGQVLRVEKLAAQPGDKVNFDSVLLVDDGKTVNIGTPTVAGGKVIAEVIEQQRDKKIRIIKFRRRKHSRKQMGHRQAYTTVKITDIKAQAA